MLTDLVLHLEPRRFLSWKLKISVTEPVAEVKTPAGAWESPPTTLWGPQSTQGRVDVEALAAWIETKVGAPILSVVNRLYPTEPEDYLRVIITCPEKLRATMMAIPWELFELAGITQRQPIFERFSLVRVLSTEASLPPPTIVGDTIRIAVTWANPDLDIPELDQHLENIKKLGSDFSRELTVLSPVEFASLESVREALIDQHPNAFYHIGHADPSQGKAALRIGTRGARSECDADQFGSLLQVIGPPRLVLLNSCATTVGYSMNSYLGAALSLASQIQAVITMQTMVPASSAMHFATTLFRSLASGKGLADSLKRGRISIQRNERLSSVSKASLTPFIPVLLQRTRQDSLFTVDVSKREVRFLLLQLKQQLERVDHYINRTSDSVIRQLLTSTNSGRRVTVIHGAQGMGKSTSVRRIISTLLTEDVFKAGRRYLYYDVQPQNLPSTDMDRRIASLFDSFAASSALTSSLKKQMSTVRASSAGEAIAVLVAWLQEEREYGKDYSICLDSVPRDLALEIARRAANILNEAGRLILVVDDIACQSAAPINVVTIHPVSVGEIEEALANTRADADLGAAPNILEMSNGLPFLVAGYLSLTDRSSKKVDDLGETFLNNFAFALTAEERSVLSFASLCDISVPTAILRKLATDETLTTLAKKKNLLMSSEADSFHVPEILKNALKQRFESDALQTYSEAFDRFNELAEEQEDSKDELVIQLVTRWLREALRQGLAIMRLLPSEQAFEARGPARDVANKLHSRYLIENDEVGAATAVWQEYRETTNALGLYDDRSSDTRYAECLMRIGEYDEADSLLEAVAASDEVDDVQLEALFFRSNLIKERGRRDEFPLRIELLRKALAVASKLAAPDVDPEWIKRQTASLEHSLGNALGYGQNAKPEEALEHLASAQRALEDLGDPLQLRTVAEQIEIRRYQQLLTPEETQTAIATLEQNVRRLLTRGMRYDAIRHFYELGRLEAQPEKRARLYEQAFRLAGNQYQPLNWHAAIKWRVSQVKANLVSFQQVAGELEGFVLKLNSWTANAWSRRVRRNTWQFIAENYEALGDIERAVAAGSEAWKAVRTISEFGQGPNDLAERDRIGAFRGILALKSDNRSLARAIAAELSGDDSGRFEHMSEGELAAWFKTVSKEEGT